MIKTKKFHLLLSYLALAFNTQAYSSEPDELHYHDLKKRFEAGRHSIDALKDKNIVAFIGNTGAGKSTLINYLAGKELIFDEGAYKIKLAHPEDLSSMVIGHNALDSCTYFPRSVRLSSEDDALMLYDLPGLSETRGAGTAILGALFIKNVIEKARTKRIILVAGQDEVTANRAASFTQLLSYFEPTLKEDLLKLPIIFTKFLGNPEEFRTTLRAAEINNPFETVNYASLKSSSNEEIVNERKRLIDFIKMTPPAAIDDFIFPDSIYNSKVKSKIKGIIKEEIKDIAQKLIKSRSLAKNKQNLEAQKKYFQDSFISEVVKEFKESEFITFLTQAMADLDNKHDQNKIETMLKSVKLERVNDIQEEIKRLLDLENRRLREASRERRPEPENQPPRKATSPAQLIANGQYKIICKVEGNDFPMKTAEKRFNEFGHDTYVLKETRVWIDSSGLDKWFIEMPLGQNNFYHIYANVNFSNYFNPTLRNIGEKKGYLAANKGKNIRISKNPFNWKIERYDNGKYRIRTPEGNQCLEVEPLGLRIAASYLSVEDIKQGEERQLWSLEKSF